MFWPPGHKLYELSEMMETITCCTIEQPAALLQPGALGLFLIAQRCHRASFPGHLSGIEELEQQHFQAVLVLCRQMMLALPPGFQGMRYRGLLGL